jgi:PAS domain S-box-containing protein
MDGHLLEMMGKQAGMSLANAQLFRQMSEEHNINVNIVNSIANGVVSTDLRGIVLRVNPVAERIFGHGADELIGQPLTKLLGDCGCPLLATAVVQTLADGKPRQISEEKMGSTDVLLRARVTPLLTAGEKVEGAVIALEDMTQRARLESMFKQYASDQVVDMLLAGDELPSLGGEMCEATMLFLDTVGSTELLGKIGGEEMVSLMNDAYTRLVELVFHHNGTLNKYTGDGFLAVFGAPLSQPDDNRRAVLCALEIVDEMKRFNETQSHRLDIKVGISRGRVVAGNIGSPRRMEYSVIGPDVNLAARLCDQAPAGEVLVSSRVQAELEDEFSWEFLGRHIFKHVRESMDVYRLCTPGGGVDRPRRALDEGGGEARVALDVPMLQNMEVVVSHMAEAFGRYIGMDTDSIDEVRAALVEACINAFEHSHSKSARLRLEFVPTPEALTVTISDQGHGFDVQTALKQVRERRESGDMRRGWGLELVGEFMDDVRIESGPGGTTLTLVKRRRQNA